MPDAPRRTRAIAWLVVLVASGALGIYLGAPSADSVRVAWDRLASPTSLAIVLGGALGFALAEAARIAAIGRLVGAPIRARDALDAAVANHVMTALTPQVGLGEPTVAYLLHERGLTWDAAVAIPFLKFTTSLALAFLLGAVLVLAGFGPPVATAISATAVALFLAISVISLLVIAACLRPQLGRRWIERLHAWLGRRVRSAAWQGRLARAAEVAAQTVERVAAIGMSWRTVAVLALVHLAYYAAYLAPLVGLALVLGDPPLGPLALRAFVYLCFVFAMPTPGGAGPSEAAAAVFFGDLVAPTDAIAIVAVFRAATFYLQLALGVLYLPFAALRARAG